MRGIVSTPVVDAAAAFASAAIGKVHLGIVGHGAAAAETCRALRAINIPVVLLTNVANVLQVNALRKEASASLALPSTVSDTDLAAAASTLIAAPATPAPVKREAPGAPPAPAVERDSAWVLGNACRERWNGNLRLGERSMLLLEGEPIAVASTVAGEKLGELLVRKGRATAEQIERALRFAQKKSARIGASLVDMSVLTPAQVLEEVADQHRQRAIAMFGPNPGLVRFSGQKAIRPDERRMEGIVAAALVAEGVRRHYDLKRLKTVLPDTAVFRFAADAGARLPAYRFTPAEASSLWLVDGVRAVSESAVRAKTPLDYLHALYAAVCTDLIRIAA